jgi:hypothetical protein
MENTTMRLIQRVTAVFFLLAGGLILAACGGSSASDTPSASAAALPDWVRDAPPRVREAYQYAVADPDELSKYPCYCGCGAMGHTSNLSCYVQNIAPDGTITFDSHVKRLKAQGQSSPQVRAYIDAQYSSFGPGTDTPLPTE